MEETTIITSEWHVLQGNSGWRVFSKGLRPYGTFADIEKAYIFIVNSFPHKRGEILVHDKDGKCHRLYFPVKVLARKR